MTNRSLRSILVCDDDAPFRGRLARSLRDRGLEVFEAPSAVEGVAIFGAKCPDAAVVDLRMPGESGVWFVRTVRSHHPNAQIVVLTGFGSISTALDAVRSGAINYITKPASVDAILGAFTPSPQEHEGDIEMPSLAEVEAEYVHRVLTEFDGNVSRTAKVLGVHRRSLQRKLRR